MSYEEYNEHWDCAECPRTEISILRRTCPSCQALACEEVLAKRLKLYGDPLDTDAQVWREVAGKAGVMRADLFIDHDLGDKVT